MRISRALLAPIAFCALAVASLAMAATEYNVTYSGTRLSTDPATGELQALIAYGDFVVPDEDVMLLPVYFEGVLEENSVSVLFDGAELAAISSLDRADEITTIVLDSAAARGATGQLKVVLDNAGTTPSSLLVVEDVEDLPEIKSSGGDSGSGGAMPWTLVVVLLLMQMSVRTARSRSLSE